MRKIYDFCIIGAGVSGSWIALELSKYDVSVCLLEQGSDVCSGATKANSAIIHAGFDARNGTLMAKYNVLGNKKIRELHKQMAIPFKQIGSLVLAFDDNDLETIEKLYQRGLVNGVEDMKILNADETLAIEPHLNQAVKGSLLASTAGIVSAFELCTAAAEIAVVNGVDLLTNFKVVKIITENNINKIVSEDKKEINSKYVINAAGVNADIIAGLMGDTSFTVIPRKGEYCILDNIKKYLANHVIFQPPVKFGKGILVSPTVDNNILVGPTAENINEKDDKSTTNEGLKAIFDGARKSVPEVSERDVITSFTGVRPIGSAEDFIIGFSEANSSLINAAGIESPGLTAAPAFCEYIVELIIKKGINLIEKQNYVMSREVIRFEELSNEEKNSIIKQNPLYGNVICRCETVTEGEIVACIQRPAGARDMDGIKRRVRAGMGRCQSGFCGPKIMAILERELNIDRTKITKFGKKSYMLIKPTKTQGKGE